MDDFHTIAAQSALAILARMVQYLPDRVHLVIVTRVDPPLPLAQWHVRSWMGVFRAADLGFSLQEAQAFFAQTAGSVLSTGAIKRIHDRTEGWVAGLWMTRVSLSGTDDPERVVQGITNNNRLVIDFFMDSEKKRWPALLVAHAYGKLFHWDFNGMRPLMDNAEALLNSSETIMSESRRQKLLGDIDAQRGFYFYWQGDVQASLKHALRALNVSSERYPYLHVLAIMYSAGSYAMTGRRDKALRLLDEAMATDCSRGSRNAGAFLTVHASRESAYQIHSRWVRREDIHQRSRPRNRVVDRRSAFGRIDPS
ncbi:hypothetical protein [Desulfosarcina cetonica]